MERVLALRANWPSLLLGRTAMPWLPILASQERDWIVRVRNTGDGIRRGKPSAQARYNPGLIHAHTGRQSDFQARSHVGRLSSCVFSLYLRVSDTDSSSVPDPFSTTGNEGPGLGDRNLREQLTLSFEPRPLSLWDGPAACSAHCGRLAAHCSHIARTLLHLCS